MSRSPTEGVARRRRSRLAVAAALIVATGLIAPASFARSAPAVRAVLFFLPTCSHCAYVINDVLPGVFAAVGDEPTLRFDDTIDPADISFYLLGNDGLELLLVDTSQRDGAELFAAATTAFALESLGVPRLVVGDLVLVGSVDIPEQLPGIIDDARRTGVLIDWPQIPGLGEVVASFPLEPVDPTTTVASETTTTEPVIDLATDEPASPWERFGTDPVGNSISVVVLLVMAAAILATVARLRSSRVGSRMGPLVPILAAVGMAVATYLTFIEVGESSAVCGPVGDCNAVQQSSYARLFGLIPIGVLGVAAYSVILVAAEVAHHQTRHRNALTVAVFAVSGLGVLFSMYLTFLEPFVIGATCVWCLTSAILVTALMWLTAAPAARAWNRLHSHSQPSQGHPVAP